MLWCSTASEAFVADGKQWSQLLPPPANSYLPGTYSKLITCAAVIADSIDDFIVGDDDEHDSQRATRGTKWKGKPPEKPTREQPGRKRKKVPPRLYYKCGSLNSLLLKISWLYPAASFSVKGLLLLSLWVFTSHLCMTSYICALTQSWQHAPE